MNNLSLKSFFVLTFTFIFTSTLFSQTQLGSDIDGEAANDWSGWSVSLSSDGSRVAIGAYGNDGNGSGSGHVRVYEFGSGSWAQLGSDIDGEAADDNSGHSVSLSPDGSRVAIGAWYNDGNGNFSGHVRVYNYSSGSWTQLGSDIDGEAASNYSGRSVSLSSDGSRVAIGASYNNGNGYNSGHVRVYNYSSGSWTQLGSDIDGEAENDLSGFSVSLSSDGSRVAIGAPYNSGNGSGSGHVRVYTYSSGSWTQLGSDIDGEAASDKSGGSVSLSSDGSRVAIGAPYNSGNGSESGHVRVYDYSSGSWTQLGSDIDGEAADDQSGWFGTVSLSSDGSRVAIGARHNDGNGTNSGHVRVYTYSSGSWTQLGSDIDGEATDDNSGHSVSLSSDGSSVAIGAPYNSGNGNSSGHVRVYSLNTGTPTADFTPGTQQVGTVPLVVNFTDNSTNSPTGWLWHFGDGTIDTVQNPTHTYNQTGIYTVSLQASNAGGSDIAVKQALVWAKAERVFNLPASVDLNVTPGSENARTTRIYGDDAYDWSGRSVSSGDINGDGFLDVIIGATGADPVGGDYAGETYIIYGSSGMGSVAGIDLNGTPANVTRIYGDDYMDNSGISVSSGDINGDGFVDVIIGATGATPAGGLSAGETYIIYGSSGMESVTSIDLNGIPSNVTRIYGDDASDYSGISVSSGDINGDGYTDVIIGAYGADPAGGIEAGETYVIYGSSGMESVTSIDLNGIPSNVTRIYGDDASDYSGISVSSGDINGDGYTDVIIGAYGADPAGGADAGETYIIYGSSGMESVTSIDLDDTPANVTRIYGDDTDDDSGYSVSSGDINGDGYSDVIIGARYADPAGGNGAGETYIIYGSATIENTTSIDLNGTPANVTRIYGDHNSDWSGFSVSSGDINGDGYSDVIIGAYEAIPAGETYIIYGSTGMESVTSIDLDGTPANVTRINGDNANDWSGFSVSSGDINGDGYFDVIIGAMQGAPAGGISAGETYVIYGGVDVIPPSAPQNLTAVTYDDSVRLNWGSNTETDLWYYVLYRGTTGSPTDSIATIYKPDTTYLDINMQIDTAYYRLTAVDSVGNKSAYSNEVTGGTRVMQAQNLDIGGDEDLQHLITHTPIITFGYYDSMNETQSSYQVQVSTQSDYSTADMWDSGEVSSNDTSVTYAGTTLEDGVTYYLRAKVGAGSFYSDWSTLTFRMNTVPTMPVLVSPINNQVSVTPVVLKVLNAIDTEGDVITYSFNVYDDANLTTKLDSVTAVTEGTDSTSWQVTAVLPDNGQYFWTASANDGYEESTVSDAGSLLLNTNNDEPAAFSLTSPADSSEVTTLTPLLDWAFAADPDPLDTVKYTVYLDTPDPGVITISVDTATSYQVSSSLSDNTSYYWRVVATDLSGATTENIGGYWLFRINTENDLPGDFALLIPEDSSMVTDLTPTFHWEEPTDADDGRSNVGLNDLLANVNSSTRTNSRSITSYNVFISTDSLLSEVIPDTVTTNSYTPSTNLNEDMVYYWKVEAVDDDGGVTSSTVWSFWTNSQNSIPSNFSAISPVNGINVDTITPTFTWHPSIDDDINDIVVYNIYLGESIEDIESVYTGFVPWITDTMFTLINYIADNTTYYWYVFATDLSGATTMNVEGFQSFNVNLGNEPPSQVTLVAPLGGSIQTNLQLHFNWTESVDPDPQDSISYTLNWWPISPLPVIYGVVLDTNGYVPTDSLTDNSLFEWRVEARDLLDSASMSDTSHFYTDAFPEPPLAFNTVSPVDSAEGLPTEVEFVWNQTNDPDPIDNVTYTLVYATDFADSSTYELIPVYEDTTVTLSLSNDTEYLWWIMAKDEDGLFTLSNNGAVNRIVVGTLSIEDELVPVEFSLHQNYPNPFNPVTTFRYDLPEDSFVRITIYDLLGREIKTLVNQTQHAGFRSLIWDATDNFGKPVSGGIYLYQIHAGDFVQTKKMVLLK